MRDRDYLPVRSSGQQRYSFLRTKRPTPGPGPAFATVLGLVGVAAAITWISMQDQAPADPLPSELATIAATEPTRTDPAPAVSTAIDSAHVDETETQSVASQSAPVTEAAIAPVRTADTPPSAERSAQPVAVELPPLTTSDVFVRDLVKTLSAHPQLAAWLVNDELIQRFVATVVDLAAGDSPSRHVRFLAPSDSFHAVRASGRLFIDPESFQRYDLLTETFVSLDDDGTVNLYRRLYPLFNDALAQLGLPDTPFDEVMQQAVANLLAVDVPLGVIEVVAGEDGPTYEYANPILEQRTAAAKHLLRMGPDNARRVQAKLSALAVALGFRSAEQSH